MRLYALALNVLITAVHEPCQEFPGDERKSHFQEQENLENMKGYGCLFSKLNVFCGDENGICQ